MEAKIYSDPAVTITPSLAVIAGTTYAIQTINSIRVDKLPSGFGLLHCLMWLIGAGAALLSIGGFQSREPAPATVILLIGIGLFIPGIRALGRSGGYALTLSTSSGDRQALTGSDQEHLMALRQHLEKAMASAREVKAVAPANKVDVMECPRCAETIKAAAKVCRFCGHEFAQSQIANSNE